MIREVANPPAMNALEKVMSEEFGVNDSGPAADVGEAEADTRRPLQLVSDLPNQQTSLGPLCKPMLYSAVPFIALILEVLQNLTESELRGAFGVEDSETQDDGISNGWIKKVLHSDSEQLEGL